MHLAEPRLVPAAELGVEQRRRRGLVRGLERADIASCGGHGSPGRNLSIRKVQAPRTRHTSSHLVGEEPCPPSLIVIVHTPSPGRGTHLIAPRAVLLGANGGNTAWSRAGRKALSFLVVLTLVGVVAGLVSASPAAASGPTTVVVGNGRHRSQRAVAARAVRATRGRIGFVAGPSPTPGGTGQLVDDDRVGSARVAEQLRVRRVRDDAVVQRRRRR